MQESTELAQKYLQLKDMLKHQLSVIILTSANLGSIIDDNWSKTDKAYIANSTSTISNYCWLIDSTLSAMKVISSRYYKLTGTLLNA